MDAPQKMDMIGVPAEFDQGTTPVGQNLRERLPQGV